MYHIVEPIVCTALAFTVCVQYEQQILITLVYRAKDGGNMKSVFGRHIKQFHVDSNGRTDIILGAWDEKVHKAWYNKNKERLAKYKNK